MAQNVDAWIDAFSPTDVTPEVAGRIRKYWEGRYSDETYMSKFKKVSFTITDVSTNGDISWVDYDYTAVDGGKGSGSEKCVLVDGKWYIGTEVLLNLL